MFSLFPSTCDCFCAFPFFSAFVSLSLPLSFFFFFVGRALSLGKHFLSKGILATNNAVCVFTTGGRTPNASKKTCHGHAEETREKVGYGGHSLPFLGRCSWKDSPPLPLPKAHPASPWSWTLESCFAIFQRSLAQWLCPLFSLCFCKTHLQHDSPGLSLL